MNSARILRSLIRDCRSNFREMRYLCRLNARACSAQAESSHGETAHLSQDPLPVYLSDTVQDLLTKITTINPAKLATLRVSSKNRNPKIKLMSEKDLIELEKSMLKNIHFQVIRHRPPFMAPRVDNEVILSDDKNLAAIMDADYLFMDISNKYDSLSSKMMVVRDKNGKLRTCNFKERDILYKVFYPKTGREMIVPSMFKGADLENQLEKKKHVYVLERACAQFEPDDPEYIQVTSTVYEHINVSRDFNLLRSTRHFAPMAFYYAWNDMIDQLLLDMLERNLILDAKDLITLYYHLKEISLPLETDVVSLIEDYLSKYCHPNTAIRLEIAVQRIKDSELEKLSTGNKENRKLLDKVLASVMP